MDQAVDSRYFDYAASMPPFSEALREHEFVSNEFFANPSSIHLYGKKTKQKLLELKKAFCDLLQFHDGRFLMCSSGSDANNTIIEGHLSKFPNGKLLVAEDVHDSIWYATQKHRKSIKILKIDQSGQIDKNELERLIDNKITLVCLNHVCNETGVVHPVKELAEICHKKNVRLLLDGMQAAGHIYVNLNEIPCTYYTISGHKFGAVKATGGVFIRDSDINPLVQGGKQEWGLRAGTENIAGLASMVAALKKNIAVLETESKRLAILKKCIMSRLKVVPNVLFNSSESSISGMVSVCFPGITGREIVGALSLGGFAISTGSACHENEIEPSRVILAMGRNANEAKGSIRISMGIGTTEQAVDDLTDALLEIVMN